MLDRIKRNSQDIDAFLAHCHKRVYHAKSTIIYAGDTSDALYYIIKGSVSVIIEDEDGREMIMDYINAVDFFCAMVLFDEYLIRYSWITVRTYNEVVEHS